MKDFALGLLFLLRDEFDKLLMVGLFAFLVHSHADTSVVIGSLLTLVTGNIGQKLKGMGNGSA